MNRSAVAATTAAVTVAVLSGVAVAVAVAVATTDPGQERQGQLEAHSNQWFGVTSGLASSSSMDIDDPAASPLSLATFAKGLRARVVTSGVAAPNLDMGTLWPVDDPKWLLFCNEEGPTAPGVQRIDLATGAAVTVVTGTQSCDPLHATPWGTIIFGEETTTGHIYEMIHPENVQNATIDRVSGTSSSPDIVRRHDLGTLAFEGIAFLPSGVGYYGDELSPSSGKPGGSYYKFVPAVPRSSSTPVATLGQSPLADGDLYVLRVSQGSNFGQGFQQGDGAWVKVRDRASTATDSTRPAAQAAFGTGYYRPEDLSLDEGEFAAGRVRFCGNNTGREQAHYYGETMCVTDGSTSTAASNTSAPQVQLLVVGSPGINMPDNIAYQPGRGNWILHEDADTEFEYPHNNDLWSCLDDGTDEDLLSDGCLRLATLNDLDAEWTGGFFDPTGQHFYVSIQHNATGKGIVLDVTGWR